MKYKKLKKVYDKCKLIHALKKPKKLLSLSTKSKLQNYISQRYGLYRYECIGSSYNLCASYIQECLRLALDKYNWKIGCHINCHSINVLYFPSCNSCNSSTTYPGKTLNFRHRMNNHITVCCHRTSICKFENHIFKCGNENKSIAKEPYFNLYDFVTVNENKLLCYESYLHKMGFETMNK